MAKAFKGLLDSFLKVIKESLTNIPSPRTGTGSFAPLLKWIASYVGGI